MRSSNAMEISGLLTEDLPTKHFRAPSVSPPPYDRCVAPAAQSLDELKQSLFHCPTHSRIPLRLELRPTLTSTDLDTLVRTFFGLKPGDVISYGMGDQCYSTVGYEECLRTPEFQIHVTPDLRYQLHPFAHSQANLRHPSAHISGYGGPGTRAQLVSPYVQTRSSSPNSGRGHRTGSANSGRPLSLKRPYFGHAHPPVARHVDCYDQDYQQAPHHPQTAMHTIEGKLCKVEPLSSAEISLDNIVEGSRRKRTKFSSAVSILLDIFNR